MIRLKVIRPLRMAAVVFAAFALVALYAPQKVSAVAQMANTWKQPLATMPGVSAPYLQGICSDGNTYVGNDYHLGVDYDTPNYPTITDVYAIGSGSVVARQEGWPGTALFVKHKAGDGMEFMAVYGHLRSVGLQVGNTVAAGQKVGAIYDNHLHFGIRTQIGPAAHNGNADCGTDWPNKFGYVNPMPFLNAHPRVVAPEEETCEGIAKGRGMDFDGDKNDDIFWYAPGEATDSIWFGKVNKGQFTRGYEYNVDTTFVPLVGNFNGVNSCKDDILWYGPGEARDNLWYGDKDRGDFDDYEINITGNYQPFVGDFNGDDNDDIFWYGPGEAQDVLWYGTKYKGDFDSVAINVGGTYKPVVGDFNGGGKDDIMWYGPGEAPDVLWYGTATKGEFQSVATEAQGNYEPFAGDFNGGGKDDIFWYGPGSESDNMWYGTATKGEFTSHSINVNGVYKPIVGNFNGSNSEPDDIMWYGPGEDIDVLWYGTPTKGSFDSYETSVVGAYTPLRQ